MDNNMFDKEQQAAPQMQDNYQQSYQQQSYQGQPYPNQPYPNQAQGYYAPTGDLEEPVSMKEWLITLLIMMIPCVNIVMMFVWAFGNGKKSKSNFFKAELIMLAVIVAIYIVIAIVFGASMFAFLSSTNGTNGF